jgi:4-diphosphocytidyl-2-C-methyl-D-erythritol kinase
VTHLRTLVVRTPAKVNLVLRVGRRREDGFHELSTVFQAVGLYDRIEIRLTDGGIALEVSGPDLGPHPDNLAFRAARVVLEEANTPLGVKIHLEKRIPAGAGLGGGSSDAAGVLAAVNRLLGGPLSLDHLSELGARLGSDVPFFLGESPLAVGAGRGERLTPLPPLPTATVLVVAPPVHVSTAEAYNVLAEHRRQGSGDHALSIDTSMRAASWAEVWRSAANDFESVVPDLFPEVAEGLSALRELGADMAQLSGSGGACFAVFSKAGDAEAAREALQARLDWPVHVAETLRSFPAIETLDM